MISLLMRSQNENSTREMYRKRLEEVLSDGEEAAEWSPAESLVLPEVVLEALESEACVAPAPDIDGQVSGQDSNLTDHSARSEQNATYSSEGVGLHQAARQIADTLVGTFGQAIQDVHRRVAADHTRLEAAAGTMLQLSGEIRQVNADVSTFSTRVEALALGQTQLGSNLSTFSTRVDALAMEQTQLGSNLTEIDGRMSEAEQGSKHVHERLDKLFAGKEATALKVQACTGTLSALEARILQLCERLESLDVSLQSQIATGTRLSSLCEKLDQLHQSLAERVGSHEDMIQMLRSEVRQPVGMLERILGSLRALDLRKEARFPVDELVTVTTDGEPETEIAGRVVDASENGLGLVLETPLPPASKVRVDVDGTSLTGTVSYCLPNGEKHAVGLNLSQPLHGGGKGSRQVM